MSTAKVKLPEFRISLAAVGRRLSSVILRAKEGELSDEEFYNTINAVLESCVSEDFTPDPEAEINAEILAEEQAEIEKSARRRAAARKAVERRRMMREARERLSDDKPAEQNHGLNRRARRKRFWKGKKGSRTISRVMSSRDFSSGTRPAMQGSGS